MSLMLRASTQALGGALILAGLALTGCAGTENFFTTGALGSNTAASEPKLDPACVTLASRIETLRREGLAEKIEKAAAKKYKLTQADVVKIDQLTKSNSEYQLRCSTIMPPTQVSSSAAGTPAKGIAKSGN
jgi:hypothetical protein